MGRHGAGRLGSLLAMSDRADEWITQAEASRLLGFTGKSASAVPKLIRRGLLHPRRERPSLSRAEVERLRDARAEQARLRAIPKPPKGSPERPKRKARRSTATLGTAIVPREPSVDGFVRQQAHTHPLEDVLHRAFYAIYGR